MFEVGELSDVGPGRRAGLESFMERGKTGQGLPCFVGRKGKLGQEMCMG